jgi:hypothetical protein
LGRGEGREEGGNGEGNSCGMHSDGILRV